MFFFAQRRLGVVTGCDQNKFSWSVDERRASTVVFFADEVDRLGASAKFSRSERCDSFYSRFFSITSLQKPRADEVNEEVFSLRTSAPDIFPSQSE